MKDTFTIEGNTYSKGDDIVAVLFYYHKRSTRPAWSDEKKYSKKIKGTISFTLPGGLVDKSNIISVNIHKNGSEAITDTTIIGHMRYNKSRKEWVFVPNTSTYKVNTLRHKQTNIDSASIF